MVQVLCSGFPNEGNAPGQQSNDQRENACIEEPLCAHEVVQFEGRAQQQANNANDHEG